MRRGLVAVSVLGAILAVVATVGSVGFGAQAQTIKSAPCASPAASPSASPSASPTGSPVATPATTCETPVAAATAATIEAHDLYFTPNELTVAANSEVMMTIKNVGALEHDFYVDALGLRTNVIEPGNSVTVTFKAAPGSYQFYCSQPGHRAAGMVGILIVK